MSFLNIESGEFHGIIHILRRDVFVPSADTIKKDMMKVYDNSFKKICQMLQVSKWYLLNCFFYLIDFY